jgi:hypothetical protein
LKNAQGSRFAINVKLGSVERSTGECLQVSITIYMVNIGICQEITPNFAEKICFIAYIAYIGAKN